MGCDVETMRRFPPFARAQLVPVDPRGELVVRSNEELRLRRGFGQIERLINLPETVNSDSIEAELKDGVLVVTIGKKPEAQPRKISIKGA